MSSQPPFTIKELDGSPEITQPTEIVVPNGSLTVAGHRAILTFGGGSGSGDLLAANNLSELTDFAIARSNLGLVIGTNVLAPNGNGASLTALNASALASGSVPDGRLSANVPLKNAVNTFSATQTFTPAVNTSALVASGYSLTGSDTHPLLDLSGTWNTSGVPTLIKANVTNILSDSGALLIDLQVGDVSKFSVGRNGGLIAAGSVTTSTELTASVSGSVAKLTASGTEAQIVAQGSATDIVGYIGSTNVFGANSSNWHIGQVPSDGFIDYSDANSLLRIGVGGRKIVIGDTDAQGNNTQLVVNDTIGIVNINSITVIDASPTPTVDGSAILQVDSTVSGFLPPRMTTAERDAIGSPAEGLAIHNTTTHAPNYYDGSAWQVVVNSNVTSLPSLVTVGTITSGTWSATTIAVNKGGTGITSFGTGIATWLGTPSSANLLAAITDETGSGALVFANTPTLVTPNIGAATGISLSVSGGVTTGSGGSTAGALELGQGTAPSAGTTSVKIYAPASVTSYILKLPAAAASGIGHYANSAGVVTMSISAVDLAADVTGDLPFANLTAASAASKLLGRGDSGAGDFQEITIGSGLSMTGTTLSASGGGGTPGGSSGDIQYNNSSAFGGSILKQGTNLIEQYNSTNGQAFQIYNTRTDGSNYERALVGWSANIFTISLAKAGTGIDRLMAIQVPSAFYIDAASHNFRSAAGSARWAFDGSGNLTAATDNAFDIGGSGASRPRTGYFGTSIIAPLVQSTGTVRFKGYTVATLPAGTVGDTAYCTDLLTPGFLTIVVGGGAVVGPVFFNGANWVAY